MLSGMRILWQLRYVRAQVVTHSVCIMRDLIGADNCDITLHRLVLLKSCAFGRDVHELRFILLLLGQLEEEPVCREGYIPLLREEPVQVASEICLLPEPDQ